MELIDTCWDVNVDVSWCPSSSDSELIDTCWDVNNFAPMSAYVLRGINRYMLGCKLAFSLYNLHLNAELIDTCWDVNKNGGSGINANP